MKLLEVTYILEYNIVQIQNNKIQLREGEKYYIFCKKTRIYNRRNTLKDFFLIKIYESDINIDLNNIDKVEYSKTTKTDFIGKHKKK